MTRRELPTDAAASAATTSDPCVFVVDANSQLLFLQDAVDRRDGPALTRAFRIVAQARGLRAIALDGGIEPRVLIRALEQMDEINLAVLRNVIGKLALAWNMPRHK